MKIDITKLRIEMARNCLTQKALAEKAGCDPAAISICIKNGSGSPSRIGKIAKALGVDIEAILPDNETEEV